MSKQNCWEYHDCGRGPGGALVARMGLCPAAAESWPDGVNHGHNGGRICWALAGTLAAGPTHCDVLALQCLSSCYDCSFFHQVGDEETDPSELYLEGVGQQSVGV